MDKLTTAVAAIAAIALIGTLAVAAEAAAQPAASAPVPGWTGCYVGGNLGVAWQRNNTVDVTSHPAFDTGGDTGTSLGGGGQAGCDYQFAGTGFTIGAQDMFDWASLSSGHRYGAVGSTERLGTQTHWFDTLTARVGYAVQPQTLVYLKAGGAWAQVDYSDADPASNPPYAGHAQKDRSGWTVGAGVEYAVRPNWSIVGEYDYIDLGNSNVPLSYNCGTASQCGFPNPYTYRVSHRVQVALIGVNYRFGWPR